MVPASVLIYNHFSPILWTWDHHLFDIKIFMISTIFLSIPEFFRGIDRLCHALHVSVKSLKIPPAASIIECISHLSLCFFFKCYVLQYKRELHFFIKYFPDVHCPVSVPLWRPLITFLFQALKILTFSAEQIISKISIFINSLWTKSLVEVPHNSITRTQKLHSSYHGCSFPYCLSMASGSESTPCLIPCAICKSLERQRRVSWKGQIWTKTKTKQKQTLWWPWMFAMVWCW